MVWARALSALAPPQMIKVRGFDKPVLIPEHRSPPPPSVLIGHAASIKVRGFDKPVLIPEHRAFGFLRQTNAFRMLCAAAIKHRYAENFIFLCIFITTVTLLIERPDDTIVAAACPVAPSYLNCSGLEPGQVANVNCPRTPREDDWGRVYAPCTAPESERAPCCHVVERTEVFTSMDMVFTSIFIIEMLLKWVADGLVFHRLAYFRDVWNWLDFAIVVISLISITPGSESVGFLKSLRTVRALRPLRAIKRDPNMRVAVSCLLSSIPQTFNVIVVMFLWFSLVGMLLVQFFQASFYRCYDPVSNEFFGVAEPQGGPLYEPSPPLAGPGSVPSIIECVAAGGAGGGTAVWQSKPFSFDTYPVSLLTLFEMSTTEGWMEVMASTMDATGAGLTPLPNYGIMGAFLSVVHIFIGAFVLLNLLVASIINNYNKVKSLNDGIGPFLTPEQQEWKEMQRLILQIKPRQRMEGPKGRLRGFLFRVAQHEKFDIVITFVIMANVLMMAFKRFDMDECTLAAMFWFNVAFTVIFVSEAVVKILGLGLRWYFHDPWNIFDFIVVTLSIGITVIDVLNAVYDCTPIDTSPEAEFVVTQTRVNVVDLEWVQFLRALRIGRVLRLVRRFRGLRQMIETLFISLPSLYTIFLLLFLIMIIFAVLGVNFFFNVSNAQDGEGRMDDIANYVYFDNAFFMLFRQTTGEAWNSVMYYTWHDDPYLACDRTERAYVSSSGCGAPLPSSY